LVDRLRIEIMGRLLWLAEVPFAGQPHRQPHLARALARRFDTLFVEPPPPLRPPRPGLLERSGLRVAQAAPLLNARPRPLRRLLAYPRVRRLAAGLGTLQVARAVRSAGWRRGSARLCVVCSTVYLAHAAAALAPDQLILDICDDPRYFPGDPPWVHELLDAAVAQSDLVTTSSRYLEEQFERLAPGRVRYLPNGVHRRFLDLASTPRLPPPPTAGFVGYFGPWVDFELLDTLAASARDITIELVGPVDASAQAALRRLLRWPHVRYRDGVPYAAVPELMAGFTVGLIPFRSTPYTRAANPIKMYEYAAHNLPIVSTAFSDDVTQFRGDVDVCCSPDAFVRTTRARAAGRDHRPTRWIAEAHTWEALADGLAALIDDGTSRVAGPRSRGRQDWPEGPAR